MIWRRLSNRVLGRGPDAAATAELQMRLSQYSIDSAPFSDEEFKRSSKSAPTGGNGKLVAAVRVDEAGVDAAMLTRVSGQGAAHSGQLRVVGAHVLMHRDALSAVWPEGWSSPLRAMPLESERELGSVRNFAWQPTDASDAASATTAERLTLIDRVHRRVLGLLRAGDSGQFEIVPSDELVRIAVYQYGRDVPDPTALEALIAVARALRDAE